MVLLGEAHGRPGNGFCTGVGRHDENDVPEIRLASIVVSQGPVIHNLQKQVEDVRMRFFDLVQQHDRMWILDSGIREQSTLVETDITRRCTDQA